MTMLPVPTEKPLDKQNLQKKSGTFIATLVFNLSILLLIGGRIVYSVVRESIESLMTFQSWRRAYFSLISPLGCIFASAISIPALAQTAMERHASLMSPVPAFLLDAGPSQTIPLKADGTVTTVVSVSVTPHDSGDKSTALVRWSVSKPSDESAVQFTEGSAAKTGVTFTKAGSYFLRADVQVGTFKDWASVVIHVFDPKETGLAMQRFPSPPPSGVHPRIFFNPEELPGMRVRLESTVFGQEISKRLQINSDLLRHGPEGFNPKGPLAKLLDGSPSIINVSFFAKGQARYAKLINGDPTALGSEIPLMGGEIYQLAQSMATEAFWCLIKKDHEGAKNVAAALTTWAKIITPTINPQDDWQWNGNSGIHAYGPQRMGRIFDKVGRDQLALCYDFVYDDMTAEQRQIVRKMLSAATTGKNGYGMDQPHYARNGNWVTFHDTALMLTALAIEGEEGYDPEIYKKGAEVFADFYQYSIYPDGESWESLGKGGASPLILMAMAKRGDWIIGNPHLYNYFTKYLPNCFEPYGYHYIALSTRGDSDLSGLAMVLDPVVAKYAYPNNAAIELIYRNALGENYGGPFNRDHLLALAMWGSDYQTPPGQAWQWDNSQPLTYLGRDQGLVVTRSDWTKDALYLFFDCGTNIRDCGHFDPARNLFIISALGRNWIADTGKEELAEAHNVVLIDGKGGNKLPGHLVSLSDDKNATSLCGDAKFAYDWNWSRSNATQGEVESTTVNQIRFEPQPERWMDTPLTYLYSFFSPFRMAREKGNPVERALRSALLRRGDHPYVVISDSIQKDADSHRYEFLMRIPDDLENQVKVDGNDITLSDPSGLNRMLVRFVTPAKLDITQRTVVIRKDMGKPKPILSAAVDAITPEYRVLFYPFKEGGSLPKTNWNEATQRMAIQFDQHTDVVQFSNPSSQSTGLVLLDPR